MLCFPNLHTLMLFDWTRYNLDDIAAATPAELVFRKPVLNSLLAILGASKVTHLTIMDTLAEGWFRFSREAGSAWTWERYYYF